MDTSPTDPDALETTRGGKDELEKWNWGAFLWGVIWAFGHRLWKQAILSLVATVVTLGLAGIVISVWFALKGNRWIWARGGYASKEELRQKERKWAWAYLWIFGGILVLGLVATLLGG
jgi:hypothetical protein